jgi:hypothetical protein
MSPLFLRIFTLVGMALAFASLQLKARADTLGAPQVRQVRQVPASPASTAAALEKDFRAASHP